ncbi:MAG TPA: nuclear transport factor 2 family protein [Opitutaceae bacterium]|nr:nuclear transport factor 2 family protein [Opitutaceae bacterium]
MEFIATLGVCAIFLLASFAYATEPKSIVKETSPDADVVTAFIAAINRHDVAALADLMSEDHTFIDSRGGRVSGRQEMIAGWKAYFAMFPDYQILVDARLNQNGTVAVFGSVSGTYNGKRGLVPKNRIAMPAAWKANVADGKVKLWQVYCDWTEGMQIIEEDKKSG